MASSERASETTPPVGYPRKRRQTRRRLLDAGTRVLAERGPGNFGASDVAHAADVAPGTFYNHFETLDLFIDAVAHDLGRGVEIGRDTLAEIEHDPARRVTLGILQLLDMAVRTPAAAAAFVSLTGVRPEFRQRIRTLVDQAVRDGAVTGAFSMAPGDAATNAVLGTTLQSMRSIVLGESDGGDSTEVARLVLRLLGTDDADVAAILSDAIEVGPDAARGRAEAPQV